MGVVVVMGVSGAGKSTIGRLLAERLGWGFAEGDDLHSASNIAAMTTGVALTEEQRRPWLQDIARWIDEQLAGETSGVITCSALRRSYRQILAREGVTFVYLAVSPQEALRRLIQRTGHFMPASLLDSQVQLLEPPRESEDAIRINADGEPGVIVQDILQELLRRS